MYILHEGLKTVGKLKWDPRSRIGLYLRHSREYSSNAPYVLNPNIGYTSTLDYIVCNDNFSTITFHIFRRSRYVEILITIATIYGDILEQ